MQAGNIKLLQLSTHSETQNLQVGEVIKSCHIVDPSISLKDSGIHARLKNDVTVSDRSNPALFHQFICKIV